MTPIAIVTGGAQGIGLALTRHLLQESWRVVVLDIDSEAVDELQGESRDAPLLALDVDVADEDAVARAFARCRRWQAEAAEPEGIDLLVNNAGRSEAVSGPIDELSLARWRQWIDSHLTGAFLCTRAAVEGLRARRGSIVNISSTRALQSEPHCEAYAAAKGGLLSLTHALALSLGPDVRVNAICPGWIETGPLKKRSRRSSPAHRPVDHAQHPAGRVGEASDVVAAVEFLASEGSGFITGQTLVIDGGMTRRMFYEL